MSDWHLRYVFHICHPQGPLEITPPGTHFRIAPREQRRVRMASARCVPRPCPVVNPETLLLL